MPSTFWMQYFRLIHVYFFGSQFEVPTDPPMPNYYNYFPLPSSGCTVWWERWSRVVLEVKNCRRLTKNYFQNRIQYMFVPAGPSPAIQLREVHVVYTINCLIQLLHVTVVTHVRFRWGNQANHVCLSVCFERVDLRTNLYIHVTDPWNPGCPALKLKMNKVSFSSHPHLKGGHFYASSTQVLLKHRPDMATFTWLVNREALHCTNDNWLSLLSQTF